MRKQHRIAASLAAVLITGGFASTAAADAGSPDAAELVGRTLFTVPADPHWVVRAELSASALGQAPAPAPVPVTVVAPAPEPAPTPAPPPARASRSGRVVQAAGGDPFARLRQCESGGNYAANTGNGYYGAYQFSLGTWRSLGYGGYPHQASPATQDEAARRLQARSGWGQWPSCSRRLGLR